MKKIQRYWIVEVILLVIALGGLSLAVFNTVSARDSQVLVGREQPAVPVVVDSERDSGGGETAVLATEDDVEALEADEGDFDEAEAVDETEADEADLLEVAAQVIGVDIEVLELEMLLGKSMAEVAMTNGVEPQQVIDALAAQELAVIDSLMQSGEIDEAEAAEWRDEVARFMPFMVNTIYLEPEVVAAQTIGMELDLFWEAVDAGQTIRALAEAKNVDPQVVIDAIIASENELADKMLAAELIEVEEHSEWLAENGRVAEDIVNLPLDSWDTEESMDE